MLTYYFKIHHLFVFDLARYDVVINSEDLFTQDDLLHYLLVQQVFVDHVATITTDKY